MSEIKEVKKEESTGAAPAAAAPAFENAEGDARAKRGLKPKRRPCGFCMAKITYIDYKDIGRLRKYVTEKGKIISRRQTGLCARHQREVTQAIKRARQMSLL
jgi:small subunit ribosomal protein S18